MRPCFHLCRATSMSTDSRRHDRARFIAFGLLSLLDVFALLLHGLNLATHGRGGAAASLPWLVLLVVALLFVTLWAAIRRGHDLGWSAWAAVGACAGSLLLGPVVLVLAGYLTVAKGQPESNRFGAAPSRATPSTWLLAALLLAAPWAILAAAARMLE